MTRAEHQQKYCTNSFHKTQNVTQRKYLQRNFFVICIGFEIAKRKIAQFIFTGIKWYSKKIIDNDISLYWFGNKEYSKKTETQITNMW